MKVKVEVDIDDLIQDMSEEGDYDLNESLKSRIIHQTILIILPKIKENVEKTIFKRIDKIVEDRITSAVDRSVDAAVQKGMITVRGKSVSILSYVQARFSESSGWNNPNEKIDRVAKEFGKELKLQYDNAFANRVVVNMKEQGLLKDDVVKILLGDGK